LIAQLSGVFRYFALFHLQLCRPLWIRSRSPQRIEAVVAVKVVVLLTIGLASILFGAIPHMFGWTIILSFFLSEEFRLVMLWFCLGCFHSVFGCNLPVVLVLQQLEEGRWENLIRGEIAFCILC
jgi:hypothetical protein